MSGCKADFYRQLPRREALHQLDDSNVSSVLILVFHSCLLFLLIAPCRRDLA